MISTKHRAKTLKGVISACERKMNTALKRQNIAEAFAFARLQALGNAVVWQQVYPLAQALTEWLAG